MSRVEARTAGIATISRVETVGPLELVIILVIVALLFGSSKLPELARSLGRAKSEFNAGVRDGASPDEKAS
jgi:sec-independent protein translocase protein TatA